MKRFDNDVVGADLCVRPDAEVDVSGQTHRSAPTVSSLVTKVRNLSPPLCASSAVEAFRFARDASSPAVIPNSLGESVSAGFTVPASLLPFAFSQG